MHAGEGSAQQPLTPKVENTIREKYEIARQARAALDDESSIPAVPTHRLLLEFGPDDIRTAFKALW